MIAVLCLFILAARPGSASAAYNITDWALTPSTTQAGGHPNIHYHVDPDAALADGAGDDLKTVTLEYPSGLLANPEAANAKCTATQFSTDKCPTTSYVGAISTKLRVLNGLATITAPGSVYMLTPPTAGSAATVGFIVRPPGYKIIFMKTEVTGVAKVRVGTDADYGVTLSVDNIPRYLVTTWGSNVAATVQDISVDINSKANTGKTGPYFNLNPTRCDSANSKLTVTSYSGVVITKNSAFTPTGCASVPFSATSSYTPSTTKAGANTGMSATFTAPTADATIQNSEIKTIQSDMPSGTKLDFPKLSTYTDCPEATVNADGCAATSKIGNVSVSVPFLPPVMTGDIFKIEAGASLKFGYVLHGYNGTKAPLKGEVTVPDVDGDGVADYVRAIATTLPQVPWASATMNFSAPVMKNPSTCGTQTINTKITGWTGAVLNKTNTYVTDQCASDVTPPQLDISAPVNGSTTNSQTTTLSYTASDASGVTCNKASGSTVSLTPGLNTISVTCTDGASPANSTTKSVQVTFADIAAPVIGNVSPANGSVVGGSSLTLSYTATDNSTVAPTCSPASGSSVALPLADANAVTITCTDGSGNSASMPLTYYRDSVGPTINISNPTDLLQTQASTVTLNFTATDNYPGTVTCNQTNGATITLNAVNTPTPITVTCTDARGNSSSKTVTVTKIAAPPIVLTISSPTAGTITAASSIPVSYTATGGTGTITCNPANGASVNLATSNANNNVTVSCTDQASPTPSTATKTVVVYRDNAGPVLTGLPTGTSYTKTAAYSVPAYTATDASGVTPTCTQTPSNPITLAAGPNTISVSCQDSVGNVTNASWTVYLDQTGPVISGTPTGTSYTKTASYTFPSYTATDNSGQTPTCTPAAGSTSTLVAGPNTKSVTCTDAATNSTTSASWIVYLDTTNPTVTITSPADNSTTTLSSTTVTYTSADNSGVAPTCSPASGTSVALNSGLNTITITCTDAAGNPGTGVVHVTRGTRSAPVITVTAPLDGLNTQATTTTLAFTALDADGVAVTNCTPSNGQTVNLTAGANAIVVSCTDTQGVTGTKTVNVFRDNTAPTLTGLPSGTIYTKTASYAIPAFTAADNAPAAPVCTPAAGSTSTLVAGPNTKSVTCQDLAGNSATVSWTVYLDTTPPTATGLPTGTVFVSSASYAIPAYTSADNSGVAPTCTPAAGTTSTLVSGNNNKSVVCTDAAGNTATYAWIVNLNSSGPVITGLPANGSTSYTKTAAYTVPAYTATDPSGTPTCTQTPAAPITLVAGPNTISVTCTNAASVSTTISWTVYLDTTNPTITGLPSGTQYAKVGAGQYTIPPYTAADNSGQAPTCTPAAGSTVTVAAGSQTITITCTDAAGNVGTGSITVFGDSTAPTATGLPTGTVYTKTAAYAIPSYTGADNSGVTPTCTPAVGTTSTLAVGANAKSVVCTDAAGNSATFSWSVYLDQTNPTATISSPANGLVTGAATVTLTYTSADNSGVAPTCTPASGSVITLSPGANTINVTCTDAAGNQSVTPVVVNQDKVGPVITITAPTPGQTVSGSTTLLTYTKTDNYDANPTCTPATNTQVSVPTPNANNDITVSCTDASGNTTTKTVTVFRTVNTPINLSITAPIDGTNTQATSVPLTYTATGGTGTITCVTKNNGTTFTGSTVTLVTGTNAINVTCTDQATPTPTQNSQTVTVFRDNTPPVITGAPTGTSYTKTAAYAIPSYGATDNSGATPTCTPAVGATSTLAAGANTKSVTCTDPAGNSATSTWTVFLDQINPTVSGLPSGTIYQKASTYTIPSYTGTDTGTNNSGLTPTCSPAVNASVPVNTGSNTVTVTCTDAAGNTGTGSVTVFVDNTAPVVSGLPSGTQYAKVGAGQYTIPSYTGTDNSGPAPTCTPAVGATVTTVAGNQTITITCTDGAGNAGTGTITVFGDSTAPTVTGLPTAGSTVYTKTASYPIPAYTGADNSGQTPTCTPAAGSTTTLSAGANAKSVTCTDGAGNSVTVSWTAFLDTIAPAITGSLPANGSTVYTNNATYAIPAYTGTDTGTNNSGQTPTCTPAAASTSTLVAGNNAKSVTCTDAAGNATTISWTVVLDQTAPTITGLPAQGSTSYTKTASYAIPAYTGADASGTPTCTPAAGSTSTLVAGANAKSVTCTDAANNSFVVSWTVFLDTIAPAITGLPANGSTTYTKTAAYAIPAYTGTDTGTNNSGLTPTCAPAAGSTSTLSPGTNAEGVTCTDAAGNATTISWTMFLDQTNPTVTGLPSGTQYSKLTTYVIPSYTGSDNSGQTPTCTPAVGASVTIVAGTQTVTISCTDAAGNVGTGSITVFGDSIVPTITGAPTGTTYTKTASYTFPSYTGADNSGPAPTCSPAVGSVTTLAAGANTKTITCTDGAGNVATATWTVFLDTIAPAITGLPANGSTSYTQLGSYTIPAYTGTDTGTNNSGLTPTCTPAAGSSVALVAGPNTVSVTCTDAATNATNVTYTVYRDQTAPTITGSLPANGSTIYTQTASYAIPAYTGADNSGPAPTCTPAAGTTSTLSVGANAKSVTCTDGAGNATTVAWTMYLDNTAPNQITTFSPASGGSYVNATTSVSVSYTTPTDNSGSAVSCVPASPATVALAVGSNSQVFTCTDAAGNQSTTTWTGTRQSGVTPPTVAPTITANAAPSALSTAAGTFSASLPPLATSLECSYNGGAFTSCASPASPIDGTVKKAVNDAAAPNFTTPNSGENTYAVRGVNAAGAGPAATRYIWIDDRAYGAKAQVFSSNYSAGANPESVTGKVDLNGYDDPKSIEAALPDGMAGSLSAITPANRCTLTLAKAGNCPASSLIGQATVTGESPTDGVVTATGSVYMINAGTGADAINPRYAAGAVLVFKNIAGSVTPNLGDIVGLGGLELTDQARSQHLVVSADTTPGSNASSVAQTSQYGSQLFTGETDQQALPNQTSTGNRFHTLSVKNLTLFGTTGTHTLDGQGVALPSAVTTSYAAPLIWNAHACISTAQTARPNRQNFRGTAKGYNGSTFATAVTAAYVPTNCTSEIFTPTVNYSLSSYAAGNSPTDAAAVTPVSLTANIAFPAGNQSSIKSMWITLPPYLGVLTQNIGSDANQCDPTASVQVAPSGTGAWTTFNYTAAKCFPESRVGTMTLNSPLVPTPIVGQLYFLGGGAVPNIGVRFDSSTAGNIQGLDNLGIYGGTSTVDYEQTLIDGGAACTDPDTAPLGYCQTSLQTSFQNIPDLPISSATVVIGDNTTRTDHTNGNAPMSQYVLKLANHASTTCQTSVDNDIITRMLPYSNASTSTVSTTTFAAQRKLTTPVPITGCDF
jgi:hypothetical protein